jgi:hypothetical protein
MSRNTCGITPGTVRAGCLTDEKSPDEVAEAATPAVFFNEAASSKSKGATLFTTLLLCCLLMLSGISFASDATDPAIWPAQSKASDGTMEILGWNLNPDTDYQVVVLSPEGSGSNMSYLTTDTEGDFLGDDYELTAEEREALNAGQPVLVYTDMSQTGIYEVRIYLQPWTGTLDDAPVASTTFLQN